jgi:hypothetical protein
LENLIDLKTEVHQEIEKEMDKIERSLRHLSTIIAGTTSDFQKEMAGSTHQHWSDIFESAAQI